MHDWLIPSHSSLCLYLCTVPLQPLKYQWRRNVYCDTCQQFRLFLTWIHVSALQLSDAERHNHPVLHIALLCTLCISTLDNCCFHMLTAGISISKCNYCFHMLTSGISSSKCCQYNDVCTWNVHALLYTHLILTFTSMCCMLSNMYTHAAWPHFCPKGILVMT